MIESKSMNSSLSERLCLSIASEKIMEHLAAEIAKSLLVQFENVSQFNATCWLSGELGSGKTSLTRALLQSLGYKERVKSPTYNLIEMHTLTLPKGELDIFHFDLYRFGHANEWYEAGFDEYLNKSGLRLIEWPERAHDVLPLPDLILSLVITGECSRQIDLSAYSELGKACLEYIQL